MMRRILEVLAVVAVVSAAALPQAPVHAATALSSAPAVSRAFSADLGNVTDADFQKVVLKSKKPVAVLFWAAWCGPCRMVTPNVDRLAQQHPEILAVRLDVDANPVTPAKYDVQVLPTIMVFQKGKAATRINGARSQTALERDLSPYLKKASSSSAHPGS
ncbi:thioredoxin domain-containing protein [Streptomyces viridosporus]|uniref:thioredoxin family protein n=1 Tax=Streptomyces viridosporus TaxID=67581 RepID=UPI0034342140